MLLELHLQTQGLPYYQVEDLELDDHLRRILTVSIVK